MSLGPPDITSIQRILALCVSTLIREGHAAAADEAIRQGRASAEKSGPFPSDDASAAARDAHLGRDVFLHSSLLDSAEPIVLPQRARGAQ